MKCGQRTHSNSIRLYLVHSQAPSWGWQMSRLSWTGSPINLTWTPQPLTPPHPLPKTTNPEREAGIIHWQAPPHLHCSLCPPEPASFLPPLLPSSHSLFLLILFRRGIYSCLLLVRPVTWSCMLGKLRLLCLSPYTRTHVQRTGP